MRRAGIAALLAALAAAAAAPAAAMPQENVALVTGNAAIAGQPIYGGRYIFAQACSGYGTVQLQAIGPDGTSWVTLLTLTGADSSGGTAIDLVPTTVRAVLTGTSGCNAFLARVPA